jgi:hypothetical protein
MSDRRTPNDLLANILGGKKPASDPPPTPATLPPPQEEPTTPTPQSGAAADPTPVAEKTKATFYLPEETTNDLEGVWMKARHMVAKDKRSMLSKSYLVEVAIGILVEEFNSRGSDSRLFDILKP